MNFNYHIHKSSITCPYCDEWCEDDDYSSAQSLEERVEFECESCEKKFWAESSIVYSSYSDCALNNEVHDFVSTKSHPTVFNCKNCHKHEVRDSV